MNKQYIHVIAVLLLLTETSFGISVQWAPVASESNYLLETENTYNPGGIEYSWFGAGITDPGQRSLSAYRQEMLLPGRYGGGINWDNLPDGTEVANETGVLLDVVGLPFSLQIRATTARTNPMKVAYWAQPPEIDRDAGPVSGSNLVEHFGSSIPELTLEFEPSGDCSVHGFAIVFSNSGWNGGVATISLFSEETLLAVFDEDDGVVFRDHSTEDNFLGYFSDMPITRVHIMADNDVLLGRFDDIGLIVVPEPSSLLLFALGGLALLRKRRG